MKASVNIARKAAKQRAHTATHLLHAALQEYFPQTKQAGSYVGEDELRFDFAAERLCTEQELTEIINKVQDLIYQALPVYTQQIAYKEAIAAGAKAFFADTYGEEVRMVTVGDTDEKVSLELCGGNHVSRTDAIGAFCIMQHEAVAAGVKRIVAYTGPRVVQKIQEQQALLSEIQTVVEVKSSAMIMDKLTKQYASNEHIEKAYESLKAAYLGHWGSRFASSIQGNTFVLDVQKDDTLRVIPVQDVVQFCKTQFATMSWIIGDSATGYAALYDGTNKQAKELAKKYDIQGGGTDIFVQGKAKQLPTQF